MGIRGVQEPRNGVVIVNSVVNIVRIGHYTRSPPEELALRDPLNP